MKLFYLLLVALFIQVHAYYLPGVAPKNFEDGQEVELKVNKLTSTHTQMPFQYYSLPFCKPDTIIYKSENLGEILRGDRIENSLYKLNMNVTVPCRVLCKKQHYTKEQVKEFVTKIAQDYKVHWIVDNLPAAIVHNLQTANGPLEVYETGFPLGINPYTKEDKKTKVEDRVYYLNNHINIKLEYHMDSNYDGKRIVGFIVEPLSVKHSTDFDDKDPNAVPSTCSSLRSAQQLDLRLEKEATIVFTYSVFWVENTQVSWSDRWDRYLKNTDPQIHWFSIINSLMIVLFLTGMVAMIMMRTLHADFRRYNQMNPEEEAEETGWKLVHGDVFRPPGHPLLFSVLIGNGVQLIFMTAIVMVFAVLGFLSPANRGGLMTAGIVLFFLMSVFGGYFSVRTYKMLKGANITWKKTAVTTALFYPGVLFGIVLFLNFFLWGAHSSGAIPYKSVIALISMWFGISLPLVFMAGYFAARKPVPVPPVRTNQIPRQIPEQVWYMHPVFSVLLGGILPFGAVFIELFFILSSIWGHQTYYLFGFLFIVLVILIITCAEITVVMCYFQLCSEDYHWWWRSFLTSGASALYMFLYSVFYFFTKMEITSFVSGLLYFGYTLIMASAFFLITGTVGFYACFWFVNKIYAQIKVD